VKAVAHLKQYIAIYRFVNGERMKLRGVTCIACCMYADKVFRHLKLDQNMKQTGEATFTFKDAPAEKIPWIHIFRHIDLCPGTFFNRRNHWRAIPARLHQLSQIPEAEKTFAVCLSMWIMEVIQSPLVLLPTNAQAEMMFSEMGVQAWAVAEQKLFYDGMNAITEWLGVKEPTKSRKTMKGVADEEGE
jgi:hypothetical protein